jgi:hypothetical protein
VDGKEHHNQPQRNSERGIEMTRKNTSNLLIGDVVSLDGKPRKVLAKAKAFKAPEWFITFEFYNETITRNYNSNKKWDVLPKVGA